MGSDASAFLYYGIVIPQKNAVEVLQKLQKSQSKVTTFGYREFEDLRKSLTKYLEEKELVEENFNITFLTSGDEIEGVAIMYPNFSKRVTVWGFDCQSTFIVWLTVSVSPDFESLSDPWEDEQLEDADSAFNLLREDSLFKELKITDATPSWHLGCYMSC